MKLHDLVRADRVFLGLEAADGEEALRRIAERMHSGIGPSEERVVQALMERERLGSTAVGDGFAIPHCKLGGLRRIELAFARFPTGVAFASDDGEPVRAMFVVLSPPDDPAAHLQVLSQIARVLKHRAVREELLGATDAAEASRILRSAAEAEGA